MNEEISENTWKKIYRMMDAFKEAKLSEPKLKDDDAPAFLKGYIKGLSDAFRTEFLTTKEKELVNRKERDWDVDSESFKKFKKDIQKTSLKQNKGFKLSTLRKKHSMFHHYNIKDAMTLLKTIGVNTTLKPNSKGQIVIYKIP